MYITLIFMELPGNGLTFYAPLFCESFKNLMETHLKGSDIGRQVCGGDASFACVSCCFACFSIA